MRTLSLGVIIVAAVLPLTVKITHVACRSTSWPLTFLVFTTTAVPREVLGNETSKRPLYLMAGISDPHSKTNPGAEAILGEPPAYKFEPNVVSDTRVAGRFTTNGPAKTTTGGYPYSFDVTFDVSRKACG